MMLFLVTVGIYFLIILSSSLSIKVLLKETEIMKSPIFFWKTNYTQSSREGVRTADRPGPPVH